MTEAERIKELEAELEVLRKSKEIIINPPVPTELKELAERTDKAIKQHTFEGKAILLTELRRRYDVAIQKLRDQGFNKAIPSEVTMKAMTEAVGEKDATAVFQAIANKLFWEGFAGGVIIFDEFKNEVLIENE